MQALSTENHHLHNQLAETRRAFAELGDLLHAQSAGGAVARY